MRKFIIFSVLLFFGIKYGVGYLLSDEFEVYAYQKKEPWTCHFENFIAQFHVLMSHPDKAVARFSHTLARCPETPMAESAEYNTARCLEDLGRRRDAKIAYDEFIRKYPKSKHFRTAVRAAEILQSS